MDTQPLNPAEKGARQFGCQHVEAFCLMTYENQTTGERELLWNSHDGVTPMVISSPDWQHEMSHVAWEHDAFCPSYVPRAGDRIFATVSADEAERRIRASMARAGETPEEIDRVAPVWARTLDPDSPFVVVVDEAMAEAFAATAAERARPFYILPKHMTAALQMIRAVATAAGPATQEHVRRNAIPILNDEAFNERLSREYDADRKAAPKPALTVLPTDAGVPQPGQVITFGKTSFVAERVNQYRIVLKRLPSR